MTMTHCPHCSKALAQPAVRVTVDLKANIAVVNGASLQLSPKPAEVFHILAEAAPSFVRTNDIIAALWGANPPNAPENALRVHISGLRHRLQGLGAEIDARQFSGYRLVMQ